MSLLGSIIIGAGALTGILIGYSVLRKKLNTFYAYKSHEKVLWAPKHTSGKEREREREREKERKREK